MELEKQNNKLALTSAPAASSVELMQCLVKLEAGNKSEAKMDLILRTNELMPAGRPDFKSVINYPAISQLAATHGNRHMLAILVLLVKDFCSSVNCVRNMNEDQMIEAGSMLLEECGNFRLEDYVMMFSLAKKGKFEKVKIYDRLDIQLISQMMDEYWLHRKREGERLQEEEHTQLEAALSESRINQMKAPVWNGSSYVEQKNEAHESTEALQLRLDIIAGNIKKP